MHRKVLFCCERLYYQDTFFIHIKRIIAACIFGDRAGSRTQNNQDVRGPCSSLGISGLKVPPGCACIRGVAGSVSLSLEDGSQTHPTTASGSPKTSAPIHSVQDTLKLVNLPRRKIDRKLHHYYPILQNVCCKCLKGMRDDADISTHGLNALISIHWFNPGQ